MLAIVPCEPTTNTMIHAKINTMIVRIAVATVESVLRMPHFARMDVRPANSAEPTAYNNHIQIASFSTIVRALPVLCNLLLYKSRFYAKAAPRSLRGVRLRTYSLNSCASTGRKIVATSTASAATTSSA